MKHNPGINSIKQIIVVICPIAMHKYEETERYLDGNSDCFCSRFRLSQKTMALEIPKQIDEINIEIIHWISGVSYVQKIGVVGELVGDPVLGELVGDPVVGDVAMVQALALDSKHWNDAWN